MKKFNLLFVLMMLVASYSTKVIAQHYVKVVKDTTTVNGGMYEKGLVLPQEVDRDSVCFIHILEACKNSKDGVNKGDTFKITKWNDDISKVEFKGNDGILYFGHFKQTEILVKVGDDYLKCDKFLESKEVNQRKDSITERLKERCVYDENRKKVILADCPAYVFKGNRFQDTVQYNVELDDRFEFLTSGEDIPNIVLQVSDFKKMPIEKEWWEKIKDNLLYIVLVVIIIVAVVWLIVFFINKRKCERRKAEELDNMNKQSSSKELHANKKGCENREKDHSQKTERDSKQIKPINAGEKIEVAAVANDRVYQEIVEQVRLNQQALNEQKTLLESIKLLVSNSEDKVLLAQTKQELENVRRKYDAVITERNEAQTMAEGLENEIKSLQEKSQIDGTVQVLEYSSFVAFAKNIMVECVNAEKVAIRYWDSLDVKEQYLLNHFISKFQMKKVEVDLAKWNGIIATLDLKGYVRDGEYVRSLTKLPNEERVAFLNKRFFEGILRPYVGAIVLLLEQIRTAEKIGVTVKCAGNVAGLIDSICAKCAKQGVEIDYRKLYEKVTGYDSLEIDENMQNDVSSAMQNMEEDILLYVENYAVNLKSDELKEKTRCFVKI